MAAKSIETHGQKYALLAEELYKNLKRSNATAAQLQSPEFSKVKNLDEKIESILSNPNLPDSMKARMYSEAAAEYFDLRQRAPETSTTTMRDMPLMVAQRQPIKRPPPDIVQAKPREATPPPVQVREPLLYVTPTQEPPILHEQEEKMDESEVPAVFQENEKQAVRPSPLVGRTQSFSLRQPEEEELQKAHSLEDLVGTSQPPQAVAFSVKPDIKDMFARLAPTNKAQQERMNKIYDAMKGKERIVTYDPNTYEIILHKNQKIPKSNLLKILHYVSSYRPVADKEPKGVDNFLGALGLAGMSSDLISSTKLKPFVEGVRPQPGQLGKGYSSTKIKWIKLF